MKNSGNLTVLDSKQDLATTKDGVLESVRRSLEGWNPLMEVPVSLKALRTAILEAESQLKPVNIKLVAVELNRTLAIWKLPERDDFTLDFYIEALEDLPEDLVLAALKSVRLSHKWNFMPTPGDFRLAVADEFHGRQNVLANLSLTLAVAERDEINEKGG